MGRPRKPTSQHKLHGTYRKDRHGDRADAVPAKGEPVPPWELSDDERFIWELVIERLPKGTVGEVDSAMIAGMAFWWGQWRKLSTRLAASKKVDCQLIGMVQSSWKSFSSAASKFGLTPSDRATLKLPLGDVASGVASRNRGGGDWGLSYEPDIERFLA